ncbi:LutB/LldF family L-lactate oxidation iron-sulfur protein [Hydrogenibacillus schlegelii]|nr:LutB/LldF family L-lactate oxidation iron-sulfur protein [Hydrogenibacillus schlegelii]
MPMRTSDEPSLERRVAQALRDDAMRAAVRAAQERFRSGKRAAEVELGDWEAWRALGEAIRRRTIENLDLYLTELADRVEAAGGHVFFAETAAEAVRYIVDVARSRGVRRAVKSKSMVSEEIALNRALEAAGVEVLETDLGEYIIQLAGEAPSHIIAPAIHKNRREIAALFSRAAGTELSDEPEALVRFARERLREAFMTAELGITGVNFAVAESGTLVLVTNEGNARMTTALPRIHIAVMGAERVVPTWEELAVLLTLLPRSATGQKITSYVTALTGPRRPGESDGPEEFHLVVVDNGRLDLLGTPYQAALHCIRCGACLNICPVYRQIGGHAYGSVYSGPIGKVISPLLGGDAWAELPHASSLCGACTDACPVRIPLHELLIEHRTDQAAAGRRPAAERLLFRLYGALVTRPALYRRAIRLARFCLRPLADREGWIRRAIGPLAGWTKMRDFPLPARRPFLDRWAAERKRRGRISPAPRRERRKGTPAGRPPANGGTEGGGR